MQSYNDGRNVSQDAPQWMMDDLKKSGLTAADVLSLGWHYVSSAEIRSLTRVDTHGMAGYTIPFNDPETGVTLNCPDGRPYVRVKLQKPLMGVGRELAKYLSPKQGGVHAFVLPSVHDYLQANPGVPVYLTEGEKKAVCAVKNGMPCVIGLTGNWGWLRSKQERTDGQDELVPEMLGYLTGRTVVALWDSDAATEAKRAKSFAASSGRLAYLLGPLESQLFRVDLPSLGGDGKVGLDDYIVAGNSTADLLEYIDDRKARVTPKMKRRKPADGQVCRSLPDAEAATPTAQTQSDDKQVVALPNGPLGVSISSTASELAALFSAGQSLYCRCPDAAYGQVVFVDTAGHFHLLTPAQACSEFETVAQLVNLSTDEKHNVIEVPAICHEGQAKLILSSRSFAEGLPPIRLISRCPVLVDRGGKLETITGYDRQTGIMARGQAPPNPSLPEAKALLLDLVSECHFATSADASRYLANIITPAIVMGQLDQFRAPIQYVEADTTQAGKGYLNKITAAIYNDEPAIVTQQKGGGVGSMREKFDSWLIDGRVFISFDNLTQARDGVFNSEELCSFMTEDLYMARALRTSMKVTPKSHIVMATTNGCTLIMDLVNRSCPVAIRKRSGHQYRKFPEGDLLAHVRANSARYLGAVFAVVRAWFHAGRPRTAVTAHESSFNGWAQALDWIVQNVLGLTPLLDGYETVRARTTSPDLMWLRDLAQAVKVTDKLGEWLIATELAQIAAMQGLKISEKIGVIDSLEDMEDSQLNSVRKQIGAKLSRCFRFHSSDNGQNRVLVDTFLIEKSEGERKTTYEYGKVKGLKSYRFTAVADGFGSVGPEPSPATAEPSAEPSRDQVEPGEPGNLEGPHSSGNSPLTSDTGKSRTLGSPGSGASLPGSGSPPTESPPVGEFGESVRTDEGDGFDEAGVFL